MRKLGLAAAVGIVALATGGDAQAAQRRPVVLELFTSEGCSSCPPADALLTELASSDADLLPLAFHVTYWDRLGWPDPFALEAATARQRAYSGVLGPDSIYTPQMVVDGVYDVVGSDRAGVLAAVRQSRTAAATAVSLQLIRTGSGVTVAVGAGAAQGVGAGPRAGILLVAGFDSRHTTAVRHGENAGRTLTEANIVRGVVQAGAWRGSAVSLHAATPPGEHLAALLQAPDGTILGAARLD
jgi:hypothetical protein